jgi:hypothetical protein
MKPIMSQLAVTLQTTLAGAIAQNLPDPQIRQIVLSIVDDDKRELTTVDAADYLNKSAPTLKRWRREGIGPKFRKECGGAIRYRLDWLREFQTEGVIETFQDQ